MFINVSIINRHKSDTLFDLPCVFKCVCIAAYPELCLLYSTLYWPQHAVSQLVAVAEGSPAFLQCGLVCTKWPFGISCWLFNVSEVSTLPQCHPELQPLFLPTPMSPLPPTQPELCVGLSESSARSRGRWAAPSHASVAEVGTVKDGGT